MVEEEEEEERWLALLPHWLLPPFSAVSQGGLYVVEHCEVWRYDLCVCVCHGGRIGLWDPSLAKMTECPDVALTGQRWEREREQSERERLRWESAECYVGVPRIV